jgi:hypothetical protein
LQSRGSIAEDMEPLVLTDKSLCPTDDLIFSIIGRNRVHWQKLIASVHQKYPDTQELWKYYNDGKSWLFRMIQKKKTLFWVGVLKDTFRVTFYFSGKAEPLIENSGLPARRTRSALHFTSAEKPSR